MDIKSLIAHIQETDNFFKGRAAKSIDKFLTIRNWMIGGYIVQYEQNGQDRAEYGKKILENIAKSINTKGLSLRNLKLFKQFYIAYPQIGQTVSAVLKNSKLKKGQTLSAQSITDSFATVQTLSASMPNQDETTLSPLLLTENLSFSHLVELIKMDNPTKRLYYEIEAIKGAWSVRELKRQINSLAFERTAVSEFPENLTTLLQINATKLTPSQIIKTPYVFDFLDFSDQLLGSESDLENALINDLKTFILELGHGFCFEAQQKRIVIGGDYYFVDLVFYHRILQCHVLIELKIDAFNHANAGQLNTYLQYYKKHIKTDNDNHPIGILLCTNKNEELVEFALGGMDNNLFVSQYKTVLPTTDVLEEFLKNEKKKLNE